MHRPSILAAAAMLALHVSPVGAQDGPVSAKEIQETWVGKDLIGTTAAGASAKVRLESNGTASLSAGRTNDTGTWRVANNGYCTTWNTIRAGQERCFTVSRTGSDFKVFNPDGSHSGTFTSIK